MTVKTDNITVTLGKWPGDRYILASHVGILLARHALLPNDGEERLRDEPKECLRGRLLYTGFLYTQLEVNNVFMWK